jgi:Family of unknown function (DUF6239)
VDGEHGHVLTVGISIGPMILRVALLAAIPVVAGFALLRGFLAEPDRGTATWVASAAAGAVLVELMLAGALDLPVQLVPLILAALALPLYLVRSTNPRLAGMVDRACRIAPWVVGLAGLVALVEFGRAWLGDNGPTFLHTGVVLALVALAWFVASRPRTRTMTGIVRVAAALVALALIAGAQHAMVLSG